MTVKQTTSAQAIINVKALLVGGVVTDEVTKKITVRVCNGEVLSVVSPYAKYTAGGASGGETIANFYSTAMALF